jgi:hypothetical protein
VGSTRKIMQQSLITYSWHEFFPHGMDFHAKWYKLGVIVWGLFSKDLSTTLTTKTWWNWLGVMATSHYHPWWQWWYDTLLNHHFEPNYGNGCCCINQVIQSIGHWRTYDKTRQQCFVNDSQLQWMLQWQAILNIEFAN